MHLPSHLVIGADERSPRPGGPFFAENLCRTAAPVGARLVPALWHDCGDVPVFRGVRDRDRFSEPAGSASYFKGIAGRRDRDLNL